MQLAPEFLGGLNPQPQPQPQNPSLEVQLAILGLIMQHAQNENLNAQVQAEVIHTLAQAVTTLDPKPMKVQNGTSKNA